MTRQVGIYFVCDAYNYDSGYCDLEVYDNSNNYLGTLNGARYDIEGVDEDDITDALEDGDYIDCTDPINERMY